MHILVSERVPLAEPALGSVPGEQDLTSGGDLPQVFKARLCVAAWWASAITLHFVNLLSYGT